MRKTSHLLSIIGSISVVGVVLLVLLLLKNKTVKSIPNDQKVSEQPLNISKKASNRIREIAENPAFPSNGNQETKPSETEAIEFPDTIPLECRHNNIAIKIARNSFSDFKSMLNEDDVKNCLIKMGFETNCLSNLETNQNCEKATIVIRAKVIDLLTENQPVESMNESVISNKIISSLFSENPNESLVFEMADNLVKMNFQNTEAHNVRGFYGFQSIVKNWNQDSEDKVNESIEVLLHSGRDQDLKKHLINKYAIKLLNFHRTKDSNLMSEAEILALEYTNKFPNDPDGYYLLMQISAYKNNQKDALKWVNKGLSFGESQTYYLTYQALKKEIESGVLNLEHMGLRTDPEKYFNVEDLLKD